MPRFTDQHGTTVETAHPATVVRLRNAPGVKEEKARTVAVRKADEQAEKK
ncbi:hypothetical protein MF406_14185 [Georgenia sp. TF02-10]|nr:hypothetical protein [Georgenia sp. TF02-10]UNX54081.1 hypothetical protein MF406_14185 [Georgenia sp. TF02-10]